MTFPMVMSREPMDCGAAALASVARSLGHEATLDDVRAAVGPVDGDGASLGALTAGARALGLRADPVHAAAEDLDRLGLPLVLHLDGNHWAVLHALRATDAELFDPAHGNASMPRARLLARWTGYALVLSVQAG